MKRRLFILICIAFISYKSNAQKGNVYYPKVGEMLPDHTFTDVINFPKKSFSISEYRGEWLVLDYWSEGCAGCLASFPKMNKLHRDFKGRAEIIMVGAYTKKSDQIKALFRKRSENYNLTFPSAFDSVTLTKYDIGGVPHIIVLNPEGEVVVKAATLDSMQLSKLISGKMPNLIRSYSLHERKDDKERTYDYKLPLLSTGNMANGGIDTSALFRSVLTRWSDLMTEGRVTGFNEQEPDLLKGSPGMAEAIGCELSTLFLIAYTGVTGFTPSDSLYGKFSSKVVLEVKDTANFRHKRPTEIQNSENAYAYSLKYPARYMNSAVARKILLDDLHRYFRFTSTVENREVEVYKLVVTNGKKAEENLKTKGFNNAVKQVKNEKKLANFIRGDSSVFQPLSDEISFRFYNYSMQRFLQDRVFHIATAALYGFDYAILPPVVDETGIDFKIDFEFIGDSRDYKDVITNLRKYGLDLIKGTKKMNCIVVRDKKDIQEETR